MSADQSNGSPEGVAEFVGTEDKAASLLEARNADRAKNRRVNDPVVLLTKQQPVLAADSFSPDPLCRKEEVRQVEMLSGIAPNMCEGERIMAAVLDVDGVSWALTYDILEKM